MLASTRQTLDRLTTCTNTMKRKAGEQEPKEPKESQEPRMVNGESPQQSQRKKRCTKNGNGTGNEKEDNDDDDDGQKIQQHRRVVNFKEDLELLRYFDRFDSPSETKKETHTRTQTEIREMEMEEGKGNGRAAAKKRGASSSSSSASSGEALYPGELDLEEGITEEWLKKRFERWEENEWPTFLTLLTQFKIRSTGRLIEAMNTPYFSMKLDESGLVPSSLLDIYILKSNHDAAVAAKREAKRPAPAVPKTPLKDVDVIFQLPKLPEEHVEIAFVKRPDFDKTAKKIVHTILRRDGRLHYMKLLGAFGFGKTRTGKELCLKAMDMLAKGEDGSANDTEKKKKETWVYVRLNLGELSDLLDSQHSTQTVANFLFYTFCSNDHRLRKVRETEFSIDSVLAKIKKDCGIDGIFLHVDGVQEHPRFPKHVGVLSGTIAPRLTRVFPLFSGLAADYTFPTDSSNSTVIRMELEPLTGSVREEFEVNVMSALVDLHKIWYRDMSQGTPTASLEKAKNICKEMEKAKSVHGHVSNCIEAEFASFGGIPRLYDLFVKTFGISNLELEIIVDDKLHLSHHNASKANGDVKERWGSFYPKEKVKSLVLDSHYDPSNSATKKASDDAFHKGLLTLLTAALAGAGVETDTVVSVDCKTYDELEHAGLCSLVSMGDTVDEKQVKIPFVVCACYNDYLPPRRNIFSTGNANELFKYDWSQFEDIALDTLRNRLLWFSLQKRETISLDELRPGARFAHNVGEIRVKVPKKTCLVGKRRVSFDFNTLSRSGLLNPLEGSSLEAVYATTSDEKAIDGFVVLDLVTSGHQKAMKQEGDDQDEDEDDQDEDDQDEDDDEDDDDDEEDEEEKEADMGKGKLGKALQERPKRGLRGLISAKSGESKASRSKTNSARKSKASRSKTSSAQKSKASRSKTSLVQKSKASKSKTSSARKSKVSKSKTESRKPKKDSNKGKQETAGNEQKATKLVILNQTKSVKETSKNPSQVSDTSISGLRKSMVERWTRSITDTSAFIVVYDIFTNRSGNLTDLPENTIVTYTENYEMVTGPVYGQYSNLFKNFDNSESTSGSSSAESASNSLGQL